MKMKRTGKISFSAAIDIRIIFGLNAINNCPINATLLPNMFLIT